MDIFEKMLAEAEKNNAENDLPDFLLEQIKGIHGDKAKYAGKEDLVEDLLERLEDYEPFADVGCGNESYSTADVQRVVDQICK